MKKILVTLLLISTLAMLTYTVGHARQGRFMNLKSGGSQVRELTDVEKETIFYIYQEEKLARDVYITLGNEYPEENTFANIQLSEQTHMDAVRNLCDKYSIDIPEVDEAVGEFVLPELKSFYDALVVRGKISILNALKVGEFIEEMDIDDLESASEGMPRDVQNVFGNLQDGSYNHLDAFMKAIDREQSQ